MAVSLPSPAALSRCLSLPGLDVYRHSSAILARPSDVAAEPHVLDLRDIATALRKRLAALPERHGAERPYEDLRRASRVPSALFDAYLVDTVRAFRDTAPAAPARPKAPRGPARAPREHKAASRAQLREDERATIALWLDLYIADEETEPGRVLLGELWSAADEVVEAMDEDGETLSSGRPLRMPARNSRAFLDAVEARFGARTRSRDGAVAIVRPEHLQPPARAVAESSAAALFAAALSELAETAEP
ncbi:MAG: hypothetical protein PGN15_09805 [Aeromicrobium erythreum]